MMLHEQIAKDLKVDLNYILSISARADFLYKDYTIPEKNGGERHTFSHQSG